MPSGANRVFRLPNGQIYTTVELLRNAPFDAHYGIASEGDDVGQVPPDFIDDDPRLVSPANLPFDLTVDSPTFMFTGGVWDAAYDAFEAHNWGITFPAGIRHDYDGHGYGATPAIGAFGD